MTGAKEHVKELTASWNFCYKHLYIVTANVAFQSYFSNSEKHQRGKKFNSIKWSGLELYIVCHMSFWKSKQVGKHSRTNVLLLNVCLIMKTERC